MVAALCLALAVLAAPVASGPASGANPGAPNPGSPAAAAAGTQPGAALGRTPYERRLLSARRDSLTLEPVVGEADRPNVLVLMLDDMRDDDLRFMPNVERLIADQGVRFTNMFSPQPLCCPARASFFTGLLSHNHEVWSQHVPFGFTAFDDRSTLPRWLHEDAGYETVFLGKYLNGYGRQPRRDGSSSLRYVPPGWTDWRASVDHAQESGAEHLQGGTYYFFDTTLSDNGALESHEGRYQTQLYSDITQDVIRRSSRSPRPFFMETSFSAPHGGAPREKDDPRPYVRSDTFLQTWQNPGRPSYVKGRFDHRINRLAPWIGREEVVDKPDFLRSEPPMVGREYAAVVENYRQRVEALSVVDDEVANIFETLARTGELDNTYVMLTSDNGYFLGEHRRRQGKVLPYDVSLRVPLVMRGPGIPVGEERDDPFLMVDFAPTILAAAGAGDPAPFDGLDMLDVARTGDRGWTRPVLTETGPLELTPVQLGRLDPLEREHGPSLLRFSQGVRTGRYLYVEHASRDRELYDLRRDPRELSNVVDLPRYRGVVDLLATELERLRDCDGAECSRPMPRRLWTRDPVRPATYDPGPPAPRSVIVPYPAPRREEAG